MRTQGDPNSSSESEDCLYISVYAPTNSTPRSKLPVYFYIAGGGFNVNHGANFDASGLVVASGLNIVVVNLNYRVGPYGFLASKEIRESSAASLNNGLKDQRKALQWVQRHIEEVCLTSHRPVQSDLKQFGGDPGHVVIGGGSAGGASTTFHMTAFGGRDDGLFHGVAGQSPSFGPTLTWNESQYQYNALVTRVGCDAAHDTLVCLRSKTWNELQKSNRYIAYPGAKKPPAFMYHPVIDEDFVRDSPYAAFDDGKFVRVPAFFGDDTNGGSIFAPKGTKSLAQSDTYLSNNYPVLNSQDLKRIHQLYPKTHDHFPHSGSYWRQLSNVYGDIRYMCPTLFLSNAISYYNISNWNYRYNVEDPYVMQQGFGVPHVFETHALWDPLRQGGKNNEQVWKGFATFNKNIVPVVQGYWSSFVRSYNPNTYRHPGSPVWQEWTRNGQRRLLFETNKTRMEDVDETTQKRCEFLHSIAITIQQ